MQEERLALLFLRITNALKKDINSRMEQLGLTGSQCMVLEYINKSPNGTLTQKDIELHFDLKHPTVSGILKRLERNGFVLSSCNEDDRRYKNITMTEKAHAVMEKVKAGQAIREKIIAQGLSKQEIAALRETLNTVLDNLVDKRGVN